MKKPKRKNPIAVAMGYLAADSMTKQQRVDRARRAALARWGKKAPAEPPTIPLPDGHPAGEVAS